MSRSAHSQIFSRANIDAACRKYVSASNKRGAAGIDGISVLAFSKNLERHVAHIHRDVRDGFKFSALKPIPIEKPNGKGHRVICVPTVRDRVIQRILVDHLMAHPAASRIRNAVSFGFMRSEGSDRRGVSAARDRALELRRSHPWAYKSDICQFFDNISRSDVVDRAITIYRTKSLRALLQEVVSCEASPSDKATARILQTCGIRAGHGVRQGMPASPFLSNVILERFDKTMVEYGFHMVRYADDFIVLCDSESECKEVDAIARELLQKEGFQLPSLEVGSKTHIASPDAAAEFLGLSLERHEQTDYRLMIAEPQLAKIKDSLSQLCDLDWLARHGISLLEVARLIENKRTGYYSAYKIAANFGTLEKTFRDAEKLAVRRIYEQAFGKTAVAAISTKAGMVLGLRDFPDPRR